MKKVVFLLVLLPMLSMAQRDFETRYFTIDATSLTNLEEFSSFSIKNAPTFFTTKLPTFKMNVENYREPVDMLTALAKQQSYVKKEWVGAQTKKKPAVGLSFSVNGSNSFDGTTGNYGVTNRVYQQQRPVYFCSPLDVYGVNQ